MCYIKSNKRKKEKGKKEIKKQGKKERKKERRKKKERKEGKRKEKKESIVLHVSFIVEPGSLERVYKANCCCPRLTRGVKNTRPHSCNIPVNLIL